MSVKMLREKLCRAQVGNDWPQDIRDAVTELINKIDHHRPLGSNGKHGNLHTDTCGCEDKPTRSTVFVVSTKEWFNVWASGQTRHERSPYIRHIEVVDDTYGIVIGPSDRVIYGDVHTWPWPTRRIIAERIALAKLAGDKLAARRQ